MPGLKQLKQFSNDIKKTGDEEAIRAERGEKPAVYTLPEGISEADDSDDFLYGLPIASDSPAENESAPEPAKSDSDARNTSSQTQSSESAPTPQLDSILNPQVSSADDIDSDLSDFLSDVPTDLPTSNTRAENTDESEENTGGELPDFGESDFDKGSSDLPADSASDSGGFDIENFDVDSILNDLPSDDNTESQNAPSGEFSDFGDSDFDGAESSSGDNLSDLGNLDLDSLLSDIPSEETNEETEPTQTASEELPDFGESDFEKGSSDLPADSASDSGDFDIENFDVDSILNDLPSDDNTENQNVPSGELPDFGDSDFDGTESSSGDNLSDLGNLDLDSLLSDIPSNETNEETASTQTASEELSDFGDSDFEKGSSDLPADSASDSGGFDIENFDVDSILNDLPSDENVENQNAPSEELPDFGDSDFGDTESSSGDNLSDLGNLDLDSLLSDIPSEETNEETAPTQNADNADASDDFSDSSDQEIDMSFDSPENNAESPSSFDDDLNNLFENTDFSAPDASQDVPDDNNDNTENINLSEFGLDDADFSDEAKSDSGNEFSETTVPSEDDFLLNETDFEIPGFSDSDAGKDKNDSIDTADFSKAKINRPRNSLTEEEYETFKKNLAAYPLNVRIIIEDLIAKNEFTDDSVFDVIEKILKKASARQIASHLEKLLDIGINVPRDYERRSAVQYEEYKSSFEYQLKNKIVPAAAMGVLIFLVGWVLFQAAVMFVYKPTMANIIYKQGYTLLESNEYPMAEEKFFEAVEYKPIKKWFFKYAEGYRDHKQYIRAANMYKNILAVFNHDKKAGLDYAEMELYDLGDYEHAEEVVRREVLDYHINDADGILLLGDIFLEWGDSDPSKYDDAREQYASLIELYEQSNLYMSRMMKYFIRTDSLANVLELKQLFYPNKKSLSPADWTELSGYLLDKLYGPLSRADSYLRSSIEDVGSMLDIAVKSDSLNPVSHYNIARYLLENGSSENAKIQMEIALDQFASAERRTRKNIYREIDANRILGELYAADREYLKAQEIYTNGISLFQSENKLIGLEGDENTGKLYADLGDIDYFISGDTDAALVNYETAVKTNNDTPSLNYRIGAIRYGKNEYDKALTSFIKASESAPSDKNLLLALGNLLSLKNNNYAAQGYYSQLLSSLNVERARRGMLYPQERDEDFNLVDMYLRANNNLGVTLYRIARQTGDSTKNAEALVRLSDSIRAWDSLTRNQQTMIRMDGSNLAAQNSKYITHSIPDFEPAIYTDIPRTLTNEKVLN